MKRLGLIIPFLLLGACNLAPKYSRPTAPTPVAFKEEAGWKRAQPRDDALRGQWWAVYGDPELNQLEKEVDESNQSLAAAEASYRQSRAVLVETRASLFPTITTSPSYTAFRGSQTVSSSAVTGEAGSATPSSTTGIGTSGAGTETARGAAGGGSGQIFSLPFQTSYEVDLWGRVRNSVSQAAANAQASAGDFANTRLSLESQAAQDYFEVRALDEEQKILNETVAAYRKDLEMVKQLFQNGIDSDEDLAQAQAQLDTAVAQATDVGTSRAQYEHALAVLVGKPPAEFSLSNGLYHAPVPPIPVALPSQLLERRPDVAAAERRVAAANAGIGIARAAYFPALSLSGTAGFESSHFGQWFEWPSRFWSVGPDLAYTLLDWGARKGQNEQARAVYDEAVANYRQTVLTAFQAVEDNLADLRILDAEVRQRLIAVASAQRYLDAALTRFKTGIDSYLNVTVAQTSLLNDQLSLVQTELRRSLASVGLIMAVGGGWTETDLPPANRLPPRLTSAQP